MQAGMRDCDGFTEHDGVRLRYRVAGRGPTVLLIHGWALDLDMWSPQFSALAERYQVVAFDRRGFGESSGQPSLSDDVSDIQRVLDELRIPRAAIVGMSQGARSALRWALRSPHATTRLVLDGPPQEDHSQDVDEFEEPPISAYRELARCEGIAAVADAWSQHPMMQMRTSDADMRSLLRTLIARYPGRDLLSSPSETTIAVPSLQSLQAPVLVINGEHDSARRLAAGAALASSLPNAQRAIVPDAGHLPNLDNPAAYNEVLCGFLREHDSEGLSPR